VIDKQVEINDSLAALNQDRKANGQPADLEPVDFRTAAYVLAIQRVSRVTLERGIWP
jgi:glutamate dehydrogenase (NAD(P)+)